MAGDMISVIKGAGAENVQTTNDFRPMCQIEIHSAKAVYGPSARIDPTRSLRSVTINKGLADSNGTAGAGSVSLTLTAGIVGESSTTTWVDLVNKMDLLVIYTSDNGPQNLRTRFIGYITDVYYNADTSGSPTQPSRDVTLQAEDLMYAFQTQLIFNTNILRFVSPSLSSSKAVDRLFKSIQPATAIYQGSVQPGSVALLAFFASYLKLNINSNQLFLMTPSTATNIVVSGLLSSLFNPVVSVRNHNFSGDAGFIDLVTQAFDDTSQFSGAGFYMTPQGGSVYQNIVQMLSSPFLEFFGDVRSADELTNGNTQVIPPPFQKTKKGVTFGPDNATFNIVLRNTPFNTTSGCPGTSAKAFDDLPMTVVTMKDTQTQQLYTTLSDVVNYYYVYPEGFLQTDATFIKTVNTLYGALVDAESITLYGLQPMEIPLLGYPGQNAYDPQYIEQFEQTLYDWYNKNPVYVRGTVAIHGNPRVRVGQRIKFTGINLVAYVESITETFVAFQEYTMQVTFSRGEYV